MGRRGAERVLQRCEAFGARQGLPSRAGLDVQGDAPGGKKPPRLDKQKQLLHNLVSLLLTQQRSERRGSPEGLSGLQRRWQYVVPCSLTTKQPISVGAWNECGPLLTKGFAQAIQVAHTKKRSQVFMSRYRNRSIFFEQATYDRSVLGGFLGHFEEIRLQRLN